jgi:hypothetical protein
LEAEARAIKEQFGSAGETERAGKRKGRNTQGTSHAGMATTPTFHNFIYFFPQKAEITHKCGLGKTYVPFKIQSIIQAWANKKSLCPQNHFFRLFPSRIESSFHT